MTSTEIHCLSWTNQDSRLLEYHKQVCAHLKLPVNYTVKNQPHGLWMDNIVNKSDSNVVGFLDSDCIPTNRKVVLDSIQYALKNKSFVGIAQKANHILKSSVYAGPGFFFIHKQCWEELGKPSFCEANDRCDVGGEITLKATELNKKFKLLYPISYEKEPIGGCWQIDEKRRFGIGTTYDEGVYHLFQGRFLDHVNLFVDKCKIIVEN